MAKKVSLINMKGGVGKSTITINLAWHFAAKSEWNKKVLVLDLDPQFNASQYLIGQTAYKKILDDSIPTIWDVFEQFTHLPGRPTPLPLDPQRVVYKVRHFYGGGCIDLIPSRLELAFSLRNPGEKEQLLAKLIAKIEQNYELILLDCAPTESFLTMAAYLASDYILVPVKPEYLSSIGLPLLVNSMEEFEKRHEEHNLELAGIVFNATSDYVPEEVKSKAEVKEIARKNGWYIFENEISYSRSYPKGAREGEPIFRTSYSRYSSAARFRAFAEEFAKRIGL
jgi:chromosome partitioning protein